ncbi:sulfotransferase family protein [Streptomyces hyaluromycini]|uniref:sulfotransferase-like domain-containing protein n=1 Tax=Streptomyces hyaluromycini TaxID=1377993 RepID=UPI000B5CA9C2|nr:sulfotransferase family protein [Streptomyces hyaluromycini]
MTHPIVFLWAHPRSRSTAFLRMMLERGDFLVLHEPFSSITVQGHAHMAEESATSATELLGLLEVAAEKNPVFVKETTEYRYDILDDPRLPHLGEHTFIIRDPGPTLASHYAMNPQFTCGEVGYEHQVEIFDLVRRSTGRTPLVMEAEKLVKEPEQVIRHYCLETGIPFGESALTWEPGEQQAWSRTSEWHQAVARSTGFHSSESTYPVSIENNTMLARYHSHHMPFYEFLRSHAFTDEPDAKPTWGYR